MTTHEMEERSFLWSEVRLVVAAVSLFVGGIPIVYLILPAGIFGLTHILVTLAWIISGVASGYLLYQWHKAGHRLFGHKRGLDTFSFIVMGISGINLGWAGIFGKNVGMTIWSGRTIFDLVALLYLYVAWYLWKRWSGAGKKFF